MQLNPAERCPCQSTLSYRDCCGRFHGGAQLPQHAEQLMLSRYTAFVLKNIPYIVQTTVPSQQILLDVAALQAWADETQWLGLEIIATKDLDKVHALVEFKAFFQGEEGQQEHHERSIFVKIDGRWYFVDPTVALPANKQPCICGSGKKFKHCCGGLL